MGVSAVQAGTCITGAFRQCAAVRSRVRSARTKADGVSRNATMHIHYPCAQSKISTLRIVWSPGEVNFKWTIRQIATTNASLRTCQRSRYSRRIIYRAGLYDSLLFFG